jgi:hypothetical protein
MFQLILRLLPFLLLCFDTYEKHSKKKGEWAGPGLLPSAHRRTMLCLHYRCTCCPEKQLPLRQSTGAKKSSKHKKSSHHHHHKYREQKQHKQHSHEHTHGHNDDGSDEDDGDESDSGNEEECSSEDEQAEAPIAKKPGFIKRAVGRFGGRRAVMAQGLPMTMQPAGMMVPRQQMMMMGRGHHMAVPPVMSSGYGYY